MGEVWHPGRMSRRATRKLAALVAVATVECSGSSRPPSSAASTTAVTAVEPSVPQGFPAVIYPPPVLPSTPTGVTSACPRPVGLEPVAESEQPAAVAAAQKFNSVSLDPDLHNADPSLWPDIKAMWSKPERGTGGSIVISVAPWGAHPPSEDFIVASCGDRLASETVVVALGPPAAIEGTGPHCLACITRFFFISRDDRPLIYLIYP
jgi:hypothetical protein